MIRRIAIQQRLGMSVMNSDPQHRSLGNVPGILINDSITGQTATEGRFE